MRVIDYVVYLVMNNRGSEWFMKNGAIPVTISNNEFQQSKESPSVGLKRDQIFNQDFMGNHQVKSYLDTSCGDAGAGARRQDFIDDWSRIGSEDDCSLTLSMQSSGTGVEFDHESFEMAVGMLNGDRDGCDVFKPNHQWLNQGSWVSSTPGGPLGEALCLGINSSANSPQGELSPHGSNSTNTSSSCTWFH